MKDEGINLVKVFSATKAKDRDGLGERVTSWLQTHQGFKILDKVVRQSSDAEFHCLSIVLLGTEPTQRES